MGIVTSSVTISLDGFLAGPNQTLEHPFGDGIGDQMHRWMFEQPEQNAAQLEAQLSAGAYILGRNMFSAGRGEWDLDWTGWWGEDPPFHAPVFVLTHFPRDPLVMQGGTTFTFVTEGIEAALEQARAAAGDGDVGIAGGADTLRQYLAAGLLDELRLHIAPIVIGGGESPFRGLGGLSLEPVETSGNELVTHVRYRVPRRAE